jgi:hypothetical protein
MASDIKYPRFLINSIITLSGLLLIWLILTAVISCSQDPSELSSNIETRATARPYIYEVPNTRGFHYSVIKIQNCEYIATYNKSHGGWEAVSLTHKGNCKNPIHRY